MEIEINPLVDKYLFEGCMRCKFGGTPKCKVHKWFDHLNALRQIALESGLTEEIKWGVPVYTYNGNNIISVSAFKDSATMGFFKGALLTDPENILQQQGKIQLGRIVKFTEINQIFSINNVLSALIQEAISVEKSGKKLEKSKIEEPIPSELQLVFNQNPSFLEAFYKLTKGRQRGYIIYFSQPKQSSTRTARIQKCMNQIFDGIGLNDKYNI